MLLDPFLSLCSFKCNIFTFISFQLRLSISDISGNPISITCYVYRLAGVLFIGPNEEFDFDFPFSVFLLAHHLNT